MASSATTKLPPSPKPESLVVVFDKPLFCKPSTDYVEKFDPKLFPAKGHPKVPATSTSPIKKGRKRILDENGKPKKRKSRAKIQTDSGDDEPKKKKKKK